jgi:hypothetical protein
MDADLRHRRWDVDRRCLVDSRLLFAGIREPAEVAELIMGGPLRQIWQGRAQRA